MNRSMAIGGVGALIAAAAVGLSVWLTDDSAPIPEETAMAETAPAADDNPAPVTANTVPASQADEKPSTIQFPEFDVVRVSEEGDTVIAGRAPEGSKVTVMDGDKEIGSAVADERGEWVVLPNEPLAKGDRELTLSAETKDGLKVESQNVVVLSVPEAKDGEAMPENSKPLAVLVPRSGQGSSRVLQKPTEEEGVAAKVGGLVLDSVDYDDDGNVTLGGRGRANAEVQVYLDNKLIGRAPVVESGNWQMQPQEQVEPGVYKLRIDQVHGGQMLGRIELPFSRAEPLKDFVGEAFVIVQPGNSLWRIARRTLGTGVQYTVIYEANQEQIRDPDLIYPGQVFEIPAN